MQPWQINVLKLEMSVLDHLNEFIHEHVLYFFMGTIYLLLAILAWVLIKILQPPPGEPRPYVRPQIVVQVDNPPPPSPEPIFDPFPPLRDTPECDPDDYWD